MQKGFEHATEPGKTQYQTLTLDRQKHMKAIVNIDTKVRNSPNKTLCVTFIAWKEAQTFLKRAKSNIKWAERPIINLTPERISEKHKHILEYLDNIRTHMQDMKILERDLNGYIKLKRYRADKNTSKIHRQGETTQEHHQNQNTHTTHHIPPTNEMAK